MPSNERQLLGSSFLNADDDDFLKPIDELDLAQNIARELQVQLTEDTGCFDDEPRAGDPLMLQENIKAVRTSLLIEKL